MILLLSIAGVFLVLSLIFLSRIFLNTRRRRYLRASASGLASIASAAMLAAAAIVAFSYFSYARLTGEQLVSSLEFRRVAPHEFQVRLIVDGRRDRFFNLKGDEWQLDARLVSWQPPLTVLGLDPIYKLERLSGRYSNIDQEQTEARTVHELTENLPIDVWVVARRFPMLAPGIDAYYGSATYVPMADGARFEVSLSRDALIARPGNDKAVEAVGKWR
jgi:amino acid transporter